jgi:intracellular septation protein A/isopentenyldiphosphate isomerase
MRRAAGKRRELPGCLPRGIFYRMDWKTLLRALLPGFAPVLVFVFAESIFGEVVGLCVGVAFGIGEFLYGLIRGRKADPFVAADTVLLAVAGALSLLLKNEVFYKMKPAVIEAVMGIGLGALLLLPPSALKGYVSSQIRGLQLPDAALPGMKRSLMAMVGVLALHIGLTVWSALTLSTAAWGFISGGLLYILFGVVVLAQFLAARRGGRGLRRAGADGEMLPVLDAEGRLLSVLPAAECHKGPGKLHPAVHLLVADASGRFYLRRRPAVPGADPGPWEQALVFHVGANEGPDAAMAREFGRQLGVALPPPTASEGTPQPLLRYRREDGMESELVLAYIMRFDGPFPPDGRPGGEGRFWDRAEIRGSFGKGVLSPQFEYELGLMDRMAAEQASKN